MSEETIYAKMIGGVLRRIDREQEGNIKKAAMLVADAIQKDQVIHLYAGGGHTWIPILEVFFRAGGFACMDAFLDYGISPFNQAIHYLNFERLPGYGKAVIDYFNPKEGEVIIIVHNIGVNNATVDAALECKRRGMKVIAVSSSEWHKKLPLDAPIRHKSGKSLFDIADVSIDDCNPFGDAQVEVKGVGTPMFPTSTFGDTYIMHRIEIEAAKELVKRGVEPPIFRSANVPGGDQYNAKMIEKYFNRVKFL